MKHHFSKAGDPTKNVIVHVMYALVVLLCFTFLIPDAATAQTDGSVPGNISGSAEADFWRDIRQGETGTVSIPNEQAGVLIQSEGDNWRALRNGPLFQWGGWAIFGALALVSLFFVFRGRIAIEKGPSGRTVVRFNGIERMGHWLLATSFIILAISGLNILYGRYVLLPVIGPDAFAFVTQMGKWLHNYVAFGFMLGLAIVLVMWIKDNIPSLHDVRWLLAGGGMFSKHSHPPAKKFNAGQKIVFWVVILCGISISVSGISLMFPFEMQFFQGTFQILHSIGITYFPTELTPMQEMQYSQLWHAIVAFFFIAVIIAHIYIGTLGMEGAFDAMGTGEADTNWAEEHHSLWMEEMRTSGKLQEGEPAAPPAE